jgi:hypothetical protein
MLLVDTLSVGSFFPLLTVISISEFLLFVKHLTERILYTMRGPGELDYSNSSNMES